jgi:hypothetical protein
MNDFLFIVFRKMRELITKNRWRLLQEFLFQVRNFGDYFDSDQINEVCVPVLLRIMNEVHS